MEHFIANKMNVPRYLTLPFKPLVIQLHEIHCANAESLVLPGFYLFWSSLSRKYDLATFANKRLRYIFLEQFSTTSEIEWLCVHLNDR